MVSLDFGSLNSGSLRRALAFGTGVGLVMHGDDLELVITRIRPAGPTLMDAAVIENFRNRPAAEWGAEISARLARFHASHVPSVVVLPREQVILRTISLPGVRDKDAAAAIGFQVDGLHPFGEEEVAFDWKRLGDSTTFLVLIVRREVLEEVMAHFAEAGVRVGSVTASAPAIHAALRLYTQPASSGFLAAFDPGELYGESPARPVLSLSQAAMGPRAVTAAYSELRLEQSEEPAPLLRFLPALKGFDSESQSHFALAYASSLANACPHLTSPANLLPAGQRVTTSRLRYIPSALLLLLLSVAGIALAMQNSWQDGRYLSSVNGQAARLEPTARQVESLDRQVQEAASRIKVLSEYRIRTKGGLDLLLELTRIIRPPGFLMSMEITGDTFAIYGETDQAEALLKALDASPLISGSEFLMPIARSSHGEQFRIRARREVRK